MKATAGREPAFPWEGATGVDTVPDRLRCLAAELLDRCRGEGPPNCEARCPLGVDARGYVQLARLGSFEEALQLVRRKLPFPGVLGYLCTHPCELHCKRIDQDSAVRIRDIKRFLAEREEGEPAHLLECEPDREERIAVVGGGPSGLLAAHDLRKRGYQVTVFERDAVIGGCLVSKIPEWRLPGHVTGRDLSIIDALGIEIRTGVEIGVDVSLDGLRHRYRAVLLLVGYEGSIHLLRDHLSRMRRTIRDTIWGDPLTCETGMEGVFAGGEAVSGPSSIIHALALGRRAAESAYRYLSGMDLRAEREGPVPGRLPWALDIDENERRLRERTPAMMEPFNQRLTEEEVIEEAGRCTDCECGLCVKDCEFLSKHCRSPKEIARAVAGDRLHDHLDMIYSCNLCSLCGTVCPEGLDTGALLLEARMEAVGRRTGPLPAHKPVLDRFKTGTAGLYTLLTAGPGRSRSKRLFFTGCKLPESSPGNTVRAYNELRRGYPGTGVMMRCCGAPARMLGMERQLDQSRDEIIRMAESVGAEELVPACPDCLYTLTQIIPDMKVTPVWELLSESWDLPRSREGVKVAIHDPCLSRQMPAVHDAVRHLVKAAGGVVKDIEYSGRMARCCGYGGKIEPIDPELSRSISRRCGSETALPMVTYCSGCRNALAGVGKETIHLLDFILARDWEKCAARKPESSLFRQINRLRTKWAFKRLRPFGAE